MVITAGWSPATLATVPIRQLGNQSAWSTPTAALKRFVVTGEIRDRGLLQLIEQAGWSSDELRVALAKVHRVDGVALARFLSSQQGDDGLRRHLGSYGPRQAPQGALVGLRSAIQSAAGDGLISSVELLDHLPTDFDLRRQPATGGAVMPVCGLGEGMTGQRGRSWLSWLVFLPACLQAGSFRGAANPPPLQPGR